MKNRWIRLCTVAFVLAVMVAGVSALAKPDLIKKDTKKCGGLRHDACRTTCEDSIYSHGACRDDKTGEVWSITVQCCCCTEGWNKRSFIGG